MMFAEPQREVKSVLRRGFAECVSASMVVGFVTESGINAIQDAFLTNPQKLRHLVIGAGTYKAFEACDRLITAGVDQRALLVNLGYARSGNQATGFSRFSPMLHSKIYLFEMADGYSRALIGSHNLTEFALTGMNGEAAILLEGRSTSPEFDDIRSHIDIATRNATVYDPSMKEAYDDWAKNRLKGWMAVFGGVSQDKPTRTKTFLVMGTFATNGQPKEGEILYFEIPEAIAQITSLNTEVHVYLFDKLPSTPQEGLSQIDSATHCFDCRIRGIEDDQGGVELQADWNTGNRTRPQLRRTPSPFRPNPTSEMQQVRVEVSEKKLNKFEYLFEDDTPQWVPSLDPEPLRVSDSEEVGGGSSDSLSTTVKEQWFRVNGLVRIEKRQRKKTEALELAFREMSPDSGNFILLSPYRRKMGK